MIETSLKAINDEILKYQGLAEGIGDTMIIKSSKEEELKVVSNKLFFEEDNVYLYLIFNSNIKRIKCVLYVTEINREFVETMISRVGLRITEENIQNYQRDPTMVEKFWNHRFIKKYNELMKYLRRSKIKYQFQEKFKPTFSKNRDNEVVENFG